MQTIWLMYSDATEATVVGWSNWEQARETWPTQERMATSDSRYVAFYATAPDWAKVGMPSPVPA